MDASDIVGFGSNPRVVSSALVAVCVFATILTVVMPWFSPDVLGRRMKAVAIERERIRARERAATKTKGGALRQPPKQFMKKVVDQLSLSKWLNTDDVKMKLASAGYRGAQAEIGFLFFRLVVPIAFSLGTIFYLTFVDDWELNFTFQACIVLVAAYLGIKAPEIFLSNSIAKRQVSMRRAFPDALDLMLICVESGMSIEHAFRKVSSEIGSQSVELAEEFALATAELAFLPDRRTAFLNLGARTGLESVKQVVTVLIQAEKYGTPLGKALRSAAQESRDQRMIAAEKMAAALPPKLTVPMIVFFLPVLLVVVMAPALMQVMSLAK